MKNNSPSQRRHRALRAAKYLRKTAVEMEFYKRRIGELCEQFPVVFNKQMPIPLAVGVHEDLIKRTSFTAKEISVLLKVWCTRWEYKCMACSLGRRCDLDGNETSWIESSQMKSFIEDTVKLKPTLLRIFCKRYKKAVGRPALICIPIKDRPELEMEDANA